VPVKVGRFPLTPFVPQLRMLFASRELIVPARAPTPVMLFVFMLIDPAIVPPARGRQAGPRAGRAQTLLPLPSATGELPAAGLMMTPVTGSRATRAKTY